MPRAATTSDVFNAIAEPRRREIIDVLAGGREHAVGELVVRLQIAQPAVSKHPGVLRKVGIVSMNKNGQQRLYSTQPKPGYDAAKTFSQFWGISSTESRNVRNGESKNEVNHPINPTPRKDHHDHRHH